MADAAVLTRPRTRVYQEDEALTVAKQALVTAEATNHKLDKILVLLGEEHEDGRGGFEATGLLGRLRRLEAKVSKLLSKYQTSLAMVAGFTGAVTLIAGLITFLVANHLIKIG